MCIFLGLLDGALEALLLVVGLVELGLAVLLLVLVVVLLLLQERDHVVDHLDDLGEVDLRLFLSCAVRRVMISIAIPQSFWPPSLEPSCR